MEPKTSFIWIMLNALSRRSVKQLHTEREEQVPW